MINLLKADFYRLLRSKGFYIAIAILLLIIGLDIYMISPGSIALQVGSEQVIENEMSTMSYEEIKDLSIGDMREIMLNTKDYALDRDVLACNMNLYYLFIFIAAIVITAEFSGGIVKNTLSSAISRNKYYISKITFVNLCCLGMFFLNTYIMYFANILFNNRNLASDFGTITKITMLQLPPILALISILTGLAFTLKKTAAFNTVVIMLMMVLQLLLSLAGTLFKLKDELFDYEFQRMLVKLTGKPSDSYILHCYLLCAAVIVGFYLLGYLSFKKAEIK